MPLVVHWPGVVEPRRVAMSTDTHDLHATLAALAGRGESSTDLWSALLTGEEAREPRARFAAASSLEGGIFMARSARRKLVWAPRAGYGWGMGDVRDAEFVFDLERDPGERVNLAGSDDLEAAWLRSRLEAWLVRARELEGRGRDAELDEEALQQLRALAYLP